METSIEVMMINTDQISARKNKPSFVFYMEEIERCEINGAYIVSGMWLSKFDYARKFHLGRKLDMINTLESFKKILVEHESIKGYVEQRLLPCLFNLERNIHKGYYYPDTEIKIDSPPYRNPHIILHA